MPLDELAKSCDVALLLDVGVTALEVAEHFDVPKSVAAQALRSVADHPGSRRKIFC